MNEDISQSRPHRAAILLFISDIDTFLKDIFFNAQAYGEN